MKRHPILVFLAILGFFFLCVLAVAVFGIFSFFDAKPSIMRSDAIAVIKISGLIHDAEPVLKRIETLKDEEHVKAVILRIDSPGGVVGPSQEIYQAVKDLRGSKKVVASLGAVAASGAYYIACGADKIVSNPGTVTGSIGVIMEFVNVEKLYKWAKLDASVLKSGKYKDVGSPLRPMSQDEEDLLKGVIDNIYGQFRKTVLEERKISVDRIDEITDGRIFSGEQAKALGLVDELGNFQTAVEMAKNMAGIKGKPDLVYPPKEKKSLLKFILGETLSEQIQTIARQHEWISPFLYVMPSAYQMGL